METLTSRTQVTRGADVEVSLNLYEYIFLRKVAIAWKQCSAQNGIMARSQIQTCCSNIILNRSVRFSENQSHMFFKVMALFSRADEVQSDSYRFLAVLSIFHKFEMFQRIKQNSLASGTLNWRELEQAATDSEGPSQKLSLAVLKTVFAENKENVEFTGLDFRQFFILMSSVDFVYIYGKEKNGFMSLEVLFLTFLINFQFKFNKFLINYFENKFSIKFKNYFEKLINFRNGKPSQAIRSSALTSLIILTIAILTKKKKTKRSPTPRTGLANKLSLNVAAAAVSPNAHANFSSRNACRNPKKPASMPTKSTIKTKTTP